MGHHEPRLSYNHRAMLLVQRRTGTFLLVLSVAAVALVLLTASIQLREAACQARAGAGVRSVFLRPGGNRTAALPLVAAALARSGVSMTALVREGPPASRVDVLDTEERTVRNEGFVLVREAAGDAGGGDVHWQLRYFEHSLCSTHRSVSMEALPNVDYERVTYNVRAVEADGRRAFLYIANVMTKDRNKITTFKQFQTLFPGFHDIVASPLVMKQKSFNVVRWYNALLYYRGRPMDVELLLEQRQQIGGNVDSWRIALYSKNPLSEVNLKRVATIVERAAKENNLLCVGESCGKFSDYVFFE